MIGLDALKPGAVIRGILPEATVTIISSERHGEFAVDLTYKTADGKLGNQLVFADGLSRISVVEEGRPWSFDGDGALFRLVSEAQRIRLAHLFDPVLAVHTSNVQPLPHQISAVYEYMLDRQPLRFLLADDPGAGKTIMAGLLIKELVARGDLKRCLIVCPGSLAEQWQDELSQKFNLPFEILTNDKSEASRTGNWFHENDLIIVRLDKLARDEALQEKLKAPDGTWDLIVCDEAHKMSASFFGNEVKYTKRYRLGQLLSTLTRNFLLMTATPHNGKDEDFQLFMALLDGDRFEGRFRDGTHTVDVSDMMRRMVKEKLLKFDGTRLFPERIAHTVPFKLSDREAELYKAVTDYVRQEFNRAEALENDQRAGTVGFALTILQRRLASSPEAIYQSLLRRRERLESRLREKELEKRGAETSIMRWSDDLNLDQDDIEDLEEAPEIEVEAAEANVLDQATAARTIEELKAEISTLKSLEAMANAVRKSGEDTKWKELSGLLGTTIFAPTPAGVDPETDIGETPVPSPHQKLVIFTEHKDTLNYLAGKIRTMLGQDDAVVTIHGGVGREDRLKIQGLFRNDPKVKVLLATDAAGEGINLQRAHLMVNYDLPWNPNRLEQRFGRIHRIGQTKVCHLWNLVAEETREGDVYHRLLEKLDEARQALGGQVFDVLGKLQFSGKSLKDLLIEAIRYGERPDKKAWLTEVVATTFDKVHLQDLLEEKALASDSMDASRVFRIREEMERAEARRLQPHYIESFFLEAFKRLGGTIRQREPHCYEVTHVPAPIRQRDRQIGIREPVLPRYERVAFEKNLSVAEGPRVEFVCPGHPLLDATLDLALEQHQDLLRRGTVLVDERDAGTEPRILFYLEHSVRDAVPVHNGERRVISRQMLYVEIDGKGNAHHLEYAPYLDYRPLTESEPGIDVFLKRPECAWVTRDIEKKVMGYAISQVVPKHLHEVRERRITLIDKTQAAVHERLVKEINYWDRRAQDLKAQEQAGKTNARLNSEEARKRAEALSARLQKRLADLNLEREISAASPVILGGVLVIPKGLVDAMSGAGKPEGSDPATTRDTQAAAAKARGIVMEAERRLGFAPVDRETEKLGYDIESRVPGTGKLRFIEVKGRVSGAPSITVTKNEILFSLNKPDDFILAIVEFLENGEHRLHYVRRPFLREPDFGVTSVNYAFTELLAKAGAPS